ncbi:hypothetical protein Vretimale_18094 [Volvox reticuliferus]|uniref:Uncharacterized protein n=1 Tax=Volvox reticuliferus TaxID=1737510 RepID=A0A8J4FWW5_9CHLO|nr:hypothetical protein Vretifemale_17739 [Volvox reticuliferus]GIM15226.1 hypothetical protein Vretimale_18094 [Volvox reticuliferus]
MLSIASMASVARGDYQQQLQIPAATAQSGAGGEHRVSDHPQKQLQQGQDEEEDASAQAAQQQQQQLQLQAVQVAQAAKAAQEAQALLAAAAAAVAAAAGGGAGMGLLAGIQLADTTGNGHAADTLRCTELPLALPLSLAVPSADGVPRLLLPAPAAAVPGGGPPGNASTGVEGGSRAGGGRAAISRTRPSRRHTQSGCLHGEHDDPWVGASRSRGPAGIGHARGVSGVLHVSGSAGSQPEGALTHVAHVLPPVMSHGSVLLGLAMDPLAAPQSQPHAQALELPHQPQLQPQASQLWSQADLQGTPLSALGAEDALAAVGLSDPERQQQLAVAVASVAAAAAGANPNLLQPQVRSHLQQLQPLQAFQTQLPAQADVGGASPPPPPRLQQ